MQKLYQSLPSRTHPAAFVITFLAGICFHTWALALTVISLSGGSATELNPLFYSVGALFFWVLSYTFIISAYLAVWFFNMSAKARWTMLALVTLMTAYDFTHDFIVLEFHQSLTAELWAYLLKEIPKLARRA